MWLFRVGVNPCSRKCTQRSHYHFSSITAGNRHVGTVTVASERGAPAVAPTVSAAFPSKRRVGPGKYRVSSPSPTDVSLADDYVDVPPGENRQIWSRFIEDMKQTLSHNLDTNEFKAFSDQVTFNRFGAKARQALTQAGLETNIEIFYWLSRIGHGSGLELDDGLMLSYASYIRVHALSGNEIRLVRILRTLFRMLNKNKMARAFETDVQSQLESFAHGLLSAALPRLCSRNRHLNIRDLCLALSLYAKMYRATYAPLFDACAASALAFVNSPRLRESEPHRYEFFSHAPFLLVAYSQAGCAHPELFSAYLGFFELELGELTYFHVSVLAYAIAEAGIERPTFWTSLVSQVTSLGDRWAVTSLGFIIAACRKLLAKQAAEKHDEASRAIYFELLKHVGERIIARARGPNAADVTFHEATDLAMACALVPASQFSDGWPKNLLSCACEIIRAAHAEFPPSYLACAFHALLAIRLKTLGSPDSIEGVELNTSIKDEVTYALKALAIELSTKICLCEPREMMLLGQALWALSLEDTSYFLAEELSARNFLFAQQREIVRKAHEIGAADVVRLSYATIIASVNFEQRDKSRNSHFDAKGALLRPWFLRNVAEYVFARCGHIDSDPMLPHAHTLSQDAPAPQLLEWVATTAEVIGQGGTPVPLPCSALPVTGHDAVSSSSQTLAYSELESTLSGSVTAGTV